MTQKNGWNKVDSDYWKNNGWLDGKKPDYKIIWRDIWKVNKYY